LIRFSFVFFVFFVFFVVQSFPVLCCFLFS